MTVTLPDGSPLELPDGASGHDAAAAIGPGPGEGRGGRAGGRRAARPGPPPARRRGHPGGHVQERRRLPVRDAPLGRARHGRGRPEPHPRHQAGLRPADRGRLLLRLRSAAAAHRGGLPRHRGRDLPHRGLEGALPAQRDEHRRRAGVLRRARGRLQGRPGGRAGPPGRDPGVALPPARLRRPVPRPAPARRRAHRAGQAPVGRRRLLARQRGEPPAHPHLRHRLPHVEGARGAPRAAGAGAGARPPPGGPRPRALPLRRGRARLPVLPAQRDGDRQRDQGGRARGAAADGLRRDPDARDPLRRALAAQRPLRQLPRAHVLHRDRRAGLRGQAHELPGRVPGLPQPPAQLSRAAAAVRRVRPRPPPRAVGGAARPVPGARLHPGRRPHLLPPRPGAGRGAGGARPHRPLLQALRLRARRHQARHAPREGQRDGGDVGRRRGGPAGGPGRPARTS